MNSEPEKYYDVYNRLITDKLCLRCRQVKPFDQFAPCASGKFGLHNYCATCLKEYNRKRYTDNREKMINDAVIWNAVNSENRRQYNQNYQNKINPGHKKNKRKIKIPDAEPVRQLDF